MANTKKSATKKTTIQPDAAGIAVRVFDGRRQPFGEAFDIRVLDGNQKQLLYKTFTSPEVTVRVPFSNNFADRHTVIVTADGYRDAGFTPVNIELGADVPLELMLLPKKAEFNFREARWQALKANHPGLFRMLNSGASDESAARERYERLVENADRAPVLACLLNVTTALREIHLPAGGALDYIRQIIWDDSMAQDRFYAWAETALLDQVRLAMKQKAFAPEVGSHLFHTGATCSYKQLRFGEANVQITFHENDAPPAGLPGTVKVELDIDYYKDPGAHALLEVIPNLAGKLVGHGGLSDPATVYALRWIAGRHAGVPEFDPPYWIDKA